MSHVHPGSFFGLTTYGTETFFEDNSLSIYNSTLPLDKWAKAFAKCDYDNSNSVDRQAIPDIVQHLYWGRTPQAAEMDAFLLHFELDRPDKLGWEEFKEGLNNFRRASISLPFPERIFLLLQWFFLGRRIIATQWKFYARSSP